MPNLADWFDNKDWLFTIYHKLSNLNLQIQPFGKIYLWHSYNIQMLEITSFVTMYFYEIIGDTNFV